MQFYLVFNDFVSLVLSLFPHAASKEEENQAGNKNFGEFERRPQHHHTSRHCQGSSGQLDFLKMMFDMKMFCIVENDVSNASLTEVSCVSPSSLEPQHWYLNM